uniref:Uncharacterized protein n=1 Tax=Brassica campestris TaxID=3711 RepID=A0A3P5YTB5_BRACM|nr:unnamed protein product [Brassica rapa]
MSPSRRRPLTCKRFTAFKGGTLMLGRLKRLRIASGWCLGILVWRMILLVAQSSTTSPSRNSSLLINPKAMLWLMEISKKVHGCSETRP